MKKKLHKRFAALFKNNLPFFLLFLLIFLFLVIYLWHHIFISIQSGEGGVLYRRFSGGTVTDKVYVEGFHIIAPWDVMTIYTVRYQVYPHKMYALTRKGLKIQLSLTIRYKPEYNLLGVLHKTVGPDYLQKVVVPEVEAVLRTLIGNFEAEEVYSTKRAIVQKVVNESLNQVSQRFVKVDDVMITEVELPAYIQQAIEMKLEQKQLAEAYEFKLQREHKEAQRKRIEAQGIHDYNKTVEASLSDQILTWKGVTATLELSKSENAKVIVIGGGEKGLPIILDTKK
ncbi:MAG: prohibitin family protein [Desulfatitalea sp.]|nr:prohibitin family protein [Desulfatitalea sp.]NNJ98978.1 prohibitin family protein [Desulfatitalea sp.]